MAVIHSRLPSLNDVMMPLALDEQNVSLYRCVLDFEIAVSFYHSVKPCSNPQLLSEYTTMAGINSRLPSLTEWHYDVIGSGRTGRTFVSLCA